MASSVPVSPGESEEEAALSPGTGSDMTPVTLTTGLAAGGAINSRLPAGRLLNKVPVIPASNTVRSTLAPSTDSAGL